MFCKTYNCSIGMVASRDKAQTGDETERGNSMSACWNTHSPLLLETARAADSHTGRRPHSRQRYKRCEPLHRIRQALAAIEVWMFLLSDRHRNP